MKVLVRKEQNDVTVLCREKETVSDLTMIKRAINTTKNKYSDRKYKSENLIYVEFYIMDSSMYELGLFTDPVLTFNGTEFYLNIGKDQFMKAWW